MPASYQGNWQPGIQAEQQGKRTPAQKQGGVSVSIATCARGTLYPQPSIFEAFCKKKAPETPLQQGQDHRPLVFPASSDQARGIRAPDKALKRRK
jgi:hypothetical protein